MCNYVQPSKDLIKLHNIVQSCKMMHHYIIMSREPTTHTCTMYHVGVPVYTYKYFSLYLSIMYVSDTTTTTTYPGDLVNRGTICGNLCELMGTCNGYTYQGNLCAHSATSYQCKLNYHSKSKHLSCLKNGINKCLL